MSSKHPTEAPQKSELQTKLNLETAPIAWRELQTFFASGSVVFVDSSLDMLHVSEKLVEDDQNQFSQWLDQKLVGPVNDQQALAWYESDATLWSVVVKPWVLVQERSN